MSTDAMENLLLEMVTGIEQWELDREAATKKINEVYAQCRTRGLNAKVLRKMIKDRKGKPGEGSMVEQYMAVQQSVVAGKVAAKDANENQLDIEDAIRDAGGSSPPSSAVADDTIAVPQPEPGPLEEALAPVTERAPIRRFDENGDEASFFDPETGQEYGSFAEYEAAQRSAQA